MKNAIYVLNIVIGTSLLAKDFSSVHIDTVKEFWDRRPCNVRHSTKTPGTREYFDEVEKRKYFVEPHIPEFAEFEKWRGKKVLEIGCGLGTESINFARHGAQVTAIELSSQSLELARKRFAVYGLDATLLQGNAEELDTLLPEGERFDLIWSFGVIHHSPHPEKILEQCSRFLKDDGELRMMVYSKISYKLFHFLRETGKWDFSAEGLDALISEYSEAQTGCPITHSYTLEDAKKLFSDFEIIDIKKTHIFPWNIQKYIGYEYEKEACFQNTSDDFFRELESELGWHILIRARKQKMID